MDMNIDEQWLNLGTKLHKKDIVAISNTGKYRRADGTEGILGLRCKLKYYGDREHCYRLIAEHFLITVRRPDQVFVDHITHTPTEYNVNDVRNLRWCTHRENMNFDEARENNSKSMKGTRIGEKSPQWKGDSAKAKAKYYRALKEYRRNPTQENLAALEEARLIRSEDERLRRAKG